MNRTSRTEEPYKGDGLNQSPNPLSGDLTTNEDLNGRVNSRQCKRDDKNLATADTQPLAPDRRLPEPEPTARGLSSMANDASIGQSLGGESPLNTAAPLPPSPPSSAPRTSSTFERDNGPPTRLGRVKAVVVKYGSFIGPGFMIAVAYSEFLLDVFGCLTDTSKSTLETIPPTLQPEPPTNSGCSSSSSCPICLLFSCSRYASSLAPSPGSISPKRAGPFSRDGSTSSCISLQRPPSLLPTLQR